MNTSKIIGSIILLVIVIWGVSTLFKKDSYIGFYYPDANNLTDDIQSQNTFDTLEDCRDWVDEQMSIYNFDRANLDDYECGKNCNLRGGQKPYICEETLQ